MKDAFTHTDAILELTQKLDNAISENEMSKNQVAMVKPLLLALLHPRTSIEKKEAIIDDIQQMAQADQLSEDLTVALLFSTVNLDLRVTNSSLEITVKRIRNTLV